MKQKGTRLTYSVQVLPQLKIGKKTSEREYPDKSLSYNGIGRADQHCLYERFMSDVGMSLLVIFSCFEHFLYNLHSYLVSAVLFYFLLHVS